MVSTVILQTLTICWNVWFKFSTFSCSALPAGWIWLRLWLITLPSMLPGSSTAFWKSKRSVISNKSTKNALYCLPDYQTSFKSIGLLVQEKIFNIDFQDGGHLGFSTRTILATFNLQVTLIPMKFWVNCPFGSGELGVYFSTLIWLIIECVNLSSRQNVLKFHKGLNIATASRCKVLKRFDLMI